MTRTDLDFLSEKDKLVAAPRKKFSKISKGCIYLLVIFVVLAIFFGIEVLSSGENLSKTLGNTNLWGQLQHLIGSGDKQLKGENNDRVNILLLGIGGLDHDGPFLSDTMMIASFKPSTKQVALISMPRDLVAPIPGYGWRKINNANAFGESQYPGGGGPLASKTVSDVFGIPIDYYIRIDFSGFEQIVDDLGGVDINVENKVDDPLYPISGKENATTSERYQHLIIKPGLQHMDGSLALKYVRSRHASGIEGSDFARSKRQQKVLLGLKEKGLSLGTLINPYRISNVMDTLSQHFSTNMEVWEMIRLSNLSKGVDEKNIIHRVFDDSPDGGLYADMTEDGAFVLRPKAGNFSEMQDIVKNIFTPDAVVAKVAPKRIEIQNGTKITGLASQTAEYLQSLGYQIVRTKNAPTQDYQKTVVYNLSSNIGDKTAATIAGLLKVNLASAVPAWVTATSSSPVSKNADVLIILGQDRKTN